MDIENLLDLYDSALRSALEKHTPLIHKTIKNRAVKSWIDHEVLVDRRKRRKLEGIMRNDSTIQTISDYKDQKNLVNSDKVDPLISSNQ